MVKLNFWRAFTPPVRIDLPGNVMGQDLVYIEVNIHGIQAPGDSTSHSRNCFTGWPRGDGEQGF